MPNDLKLWDVLFENSDELISAYSSLRNIAYTTVEARMKFTYLALLGCQNKRVVHLALHGKKKTRKKNWNRAMKIMTKEWNHE
nr:MAG TPA: hypothetical protein [Caudoviricetes sp.]